MPGRSKKPPIIKLYGFKKRNVPFFSNKIAVTL